MTGHGRLAEPIAEHHVGRILGHAVRVILRIIANYCRTIWGCPHLHAFDHVKIQLAEVGRSGWVRVKEQLDLIVLQPIDT